ncbi:MAG: clostripain-related cysteine peptidase, partial [Candidatus Hodarchaeota archaeon]
RISGIPPIINEFVKEITNAIYYHGYGAMFSLARSWSQTFFYGTYVDLIDFAEEIKRFFDRETVQLAADALIAFLDQLIVYHWQQNYQGAAHGLSIFMPEDTEFLSNYVNRVGVIAGMDWQEDTQWDNLIDLYRRQGLYLPLEPIWLHLDEQSDVYPLAPNTRRVFKIVISPKAFYEFKCSNTQGDVDIQIMHMNAGFLGGSCLINPDDGNMECCRFYLEPGIYYIFVIGKDTASEFSIEVNQYKPKTLSCNVPFTSSGGTPNGDGNGHFIQNLSHYFQAQLPKGNYSIHVDNTATTNYQLTIYDESKTELFYQPSPGFGQQITLGINITSDQPIPIIFEVTGSEGTGTFTIEVRDLNGQCSTVGIPLLFTFLLSAVCFVILKINKKHHAGSI